MENHEAADCSHCGAPIGRRVRPRSAYCSDKCRYAQRDQTPEGREHDRDRHRESYRASLGRPVRSYRRKADRLAELEARRARLVEMRTGLDRDLTAILISRPKLRTSILAALNDPASVTLEILGWIDELMLSRDADDIRAGFEFRAQVAMATTPEGLAELT